MCHEAACLGSLFIAVLVAFAALIFFLIRYRKNFLAENLKLSPDQVWKNVSQRASRYGLAKGDLLYGIYQDKTSSIRQIVVKDSNGTVIGQAEQPMSVRGMTLILEKETYQVELPLTWRRKAVLKQASGEVLSTFERLPYTFVKHQFTIPGFGVLQSERARFSFQYPFEYRSHGKVMAITQQISQRPVGVIALAPSNIPLPVRIFILAMNAYWI